MMRGGPQGGSLDDVVVHDSVICSTDQVAAEQGLGEIDYRKAGYVETG